MPLDFTDDAVESAPDFSKQAVPDFSSAAVETARPHVSDADLIKQRDAYGSSASRWKSVADAIGALSDYLVAPAANPAGTIAGGIDAADKAVGLTPKNAPVPLQDPNASLLPSSVATGMGQYAEQGARMLGYGDTDAPAVARGAGEAAGELAEGLATPQNLVLMGGAGAGGAAGAAVKAAFVTPMIQSAPEAARNFDRAMKFGDTADITKAAFGLAANVAIPAEMMTADFSGQSTTPKTAAAPTDFSKPVDFKTPSEFGGDKAAPDFSQQAVPAPPVQTPGTTAVPPVASVPSPELPTRTDIAAVPVQRVPAENIATRPDLMQFKRMDDTSTGLNDEDQIKGTWDDLKAGNLLLWQPNDPAQYGLTGDQKYVVANGHHRFAFGDSQDVPDYNAQIIKESEGYSAGDARSLAAEINIADGKGTIYDQTKFLRDESAAHGQDAALARAEQIGVKGRQAATIAFAASPDNYDSFVNERISPIQAEAIASAAPQGSDPAAEPLQRMGIQAALDGTSPQGLRNLIQAVRLESGTIAPDQLDLFGADDSAMQTAQTLSKVAGRLQNTLSQEIKSTDSAAKNASTARAKGIAFDKSPEEILADNQKLKAERTRWDNWSSHPDLVSQVREYARMQRSQEGGSAPAKSIAPGPKERPAGTSPEDASKGSASRGPQTGPRENVGGTPGEVKPSLEDKLRSLKITGGEVMGVLIPGVDPATFRAVWNTSIDVAVAALRAGKAIAEAVQAAVDHIRGQFPQGDEETLRQAIQSELKQRRRQRVDTVQAGDASDAVRAAVGPDAPYQIRTFEQLKSHAKAIIQQHGIEGAFDIFRRNPDTMQNDTRTALGAELERHFRGEEQRARANGDTARADAMAQRQVDLWRADAYGTELAQALSARNLYDNSSPQAKLKQAQTLFDEAANGRWQAAQPAADAVRKELIEANTEAAGQLRADPQVNGAAREAVNGHVAASMETHRAVVMELTEGQAQSNFVLQGVKDLVRERAGELLNRPAGRFPQPAAHLAKMMGDLATRAASIAASHYQGAEPTITLADKLAQRLGIEKSKAAQMAKTFDAQFAKMVEAAKKKIPQRIANQRARQAMGLSADPADAAVDRSIRQQLQTMNQKLGSLVTQHTTTVDATGRTIADRIIADSGLTGPDAERLRDAINRRWEKLAGDAKQSRLDQLAKSPAGLPAKLRGMFPDLIKLSNLGAFDDAKFFDLVKKKMGLPTMTDALAREIVSRANALEKLPPGDLRDRASTQLLNWVIQQRGLGFKGVLDVPMGIYISNLLSGIKTPVKILFENGTLLASQTLSTLRNPALMRHPVAFVAKPWAQGQLKGMLHSLEIMRSGIVTGLKSEDVRPVSALEQRPFGKYDDWLNIWKYPLRVVAAAHVPLFKPAMDLKATAIAVDLAQKQGLRGNDLMQRVSDIMGNTEARVAAAKAQAQNELRNNGYFEPKQPGETIIAHGKRQAGEQLDYRRRVYEILDQQRNAALGASSAQQAREYALHYTYLNEPYGFIGYIGKGLQQLGSSTEHPVFAAAVKSQIPFTTVVGNIINEHLNWTPIGLARAALSHDNPVNEWLGTAGKLYGKTMTDPAERGDLYARTAAGTILASGLAYLVGKGTIGISGPGPATPQGQRQWRDAGNEPWSVTVGNRRFSYQNTPWASSLAVLGAWNDFRKFGKGDEADANTRLAFALKAMASQALSIPMLTGVHDFVEAVNPSGVEGDTGNKLEKLFARTGGNFVAPKWLKDVDQAFDPNVYDQTGMKALVASQVPFVRRGNEPALNRLGEPVQRGVFSAWTGQAAQDPVWRAIVDKNAWIPEPDRNHIVGAKKLGRDFYRTITPDELYDVTKETGPAIRARLEQSIDLPQVVGGKTYMPLPDLDPAAAKELVRTITEEEEKKAYARLR